MTQKKEIPTDVVRFILTSIPSVPHLEALMLLRSTTPTRWSAASLAQRLYVPASVAADVMDYLFRAGVLACDQEAQTYYFHAKKHDAELLIDALATLYSSHLVDITLLIHSKLDRRAQQFANAFEFRKDR